MDHLYSANFDYGQDILFLRDWIEVHPDARPLRLWVTAYYDLADVGIGFPLIPPCKDGETLEPGWYAISVGEFQSPHHTFGCLEKLEPVDTIGYTINVYHVE